MNRKQFIEFLSLIIIWSTLSGFLDSAGSLNQKGNKSYADKRYQTALASYQNAQTKKPDQPEILYNLGTTLYQMDGYQDAAKYLEKSIEKSKTQDKTFQAHNLYNYGNTQYRLGQFDKAIDAYKKSLELEPNDKDTKHNLEVVLKKKGEFESKKKDLEREHPKKNPEQQPQSQQNKQNQGGGGGKSDQNKENQQNQQNQGDQGNQDKQKQPSSGGGSEENKQNQDKQDKNDQDSKSGKDGQDKSDETKPEQGEQNQDANKQPQNGQEQQEKSQQPKPSESGEKEPAQAESGQEQKSGSEPQEAKQAGTAAEKGDNPDAGYAASGGQYYQGQMNKSDAMRILLALQDSEKDSQFQARRPRNTDKKNQDPDPNRADW